MLRELACRGRAAWLNCFLNCDPKKYRRACRDARQTIWRVSCASSLPRARWRVRTSGRSPVRAGWARSRPGCRSASRRSMKNAGDRAWARRKRRCRGFCGRPACRRWRIARNGTRPGGGSILSCGAAKGARRASFSLRSWRRSLPRCHGRNPCAGAAGEARWVRPLHGVLCVFDGAVPDGHIAPGGDVAPIPFTATTVGHRWMAPAPFAVSSFSDYRAKLADAHVLCDTDERIGRIVAGGRELARSVGCRFDADPALLDEVAGLVEWPVPLLGTIDRAFMDVPHEVLITAMKRHQKYFPLFAADGALANRFVVVANLAASDGGAAIRAGNERVLRARLHDARFFWDQDRAATLESRVPQLDKVVFHARLGSLGDKRRRLERLAQTVCAFVPGAARAPALRAARLCKCDLLTGMVGEFAELQGVMGALLRATRRRSRRCRRRHPGPLCAGGRRRCVSGGAALRGARACRPHRYARRPFHDRRAPERLERPVRAAARSARHRSSGSRSRSAYSLARGDRRRSRRP